ncbi:hypothetical protein [Streptomyces sp. NBC_01497]|uniref:hypothetical protein n=1 Tax=Streptomyces sp. NBC_01497 TaxID=2903885 RepID=UPI002E2FFFE2|nr:hypothetical protein [Streptomyces sp. NBC_01497]
MAVTRAHEQNRNGTGGYTGAGTGRGFGAGGGTRGGGRRGATALGVLSAGVVCALAIPLAACDGGGGHDDADGGSPAPVSSPVPSPTPTVSAARYDATLATTLAPLDKALRAVDRAKEDSALRRALTAASAASATAAESVSAASTPDDAVAGNTQLAQSLRDLGDGLTGARGDGGRCATSPRVEMGTGDYLGSVTDARTALTALGYKVPLTLPRTEKALHRRLANGHFVKDSRRSGLGRLTIDNNTASDAVISVNKGSSVSFMIYVRGHGKTTVGGVRNGSYTVYFTTGSDWNAGRTSFTRDCQFQKFDDKASFHTRSVSGGTQYDVLTFSLALTAFGNATASDVPPDKFPS